ncbi:MAG: hypothetical protein KBS62_00280 [Oscillospiraceae bacterium]|nr:hypothetical protein [Candidatus Ruminococcus equi]
MERKNFINLCRVTATKPKSVTVMYNGSKYYPISLQISFTNEGECRNTAILQDTKQGKCLVYANINEIKE